MVAWKERFLIVVALGVILGVPTLLFLGAVYNVVSPREWGIGLLAWFAILPLGAFVRKMTQKKNLASGGQLPPALDARARKRILRGIWFKKVWIVLLAVSLPIGVANGIAQRAWLPTFIGGGINLFLMYAAIDGIRRRRERIGLSQQ
jgi:hypothetical protein